MKILVDGDIVVMKAAFIAERSLTREVGGEVIKTREILSENDAYYGVDTILNAISNQFYGDDVILFIGSGGGFRSRISPTYQGNRDPANKPLLYDEVRDYMRYLGAHEIPYIETDDALSILQWQSIGLVKRKVEDSDTVIATIDKDLDSVPGYHHNFDKGFTYCVSYEDAVFSQCMQMMQGDSVDNIRGIPKIGPVKAASLLNQVYPDVKQMYSITRAAFEDNARKFGDVHWADAHHDTQQLVSMLKTPAHYALTREEIDEIKEELAKITDEYAKW